MTKLKFAEHSPQAKIFKQLIKYAGKFIFHENTPYEPTRKILDVFSNLVELPEGAERSSVTINGIEADWWTPAQHIPGRVLIYSHGGGYTLFSKDTHKGLIAKLATEFQAQAIAFNYRLAPEYKFPAPVHDGLSLYRHLLEKGIISPEHTILAGDSAGGGLTLALMLAMKDEKLPLPKAAVLLSPLTDLSASSASMSENAEKDVMLSQAIISKFNREYLAHHEVHHPYASPLFGDLKGLPPIFIQAVTDEVLRDDSTRLADKLHEAGVPHHLEMWKGLFHVFQIAWPYLTEAEHAITRMGEFVSEVFAGEFHG